MSGPTAQLESPLPASLAEGQALAVFCSGTASWDGRAVQELSLIVDGIEHRPAAFAMPRFDQPVRRSGFWGVVVLRGARCGDAIELTARLRDAEGSRAEVRLGRIAVTEPVVPVVSPPAAGGSLIAICLGTYEPDPDLLQAQLESIRTQTDPRWVCVISDDGSSPEGLETIARLVDGDRRFTLSPAGERIGFYRNFERALSLAPPSASLIALADQDDVWHPDKLEQLRAALGDAELVYSDMRLVDRDARVLRETLWEGRANNHANLESLLVANTVTGAASLLRREVAATARPFPDSPGIEFHDHWIALVALARGRIAYVDRPLYDYVQHPGAILGKVSGGRPDGDRRAGRGVRLRPPRMRAWRAAYFLGYVPGEVRARTLLARCGASLPAPQRRALERYLAAGRSPGPFLRFVLRPLRALLGRSETLAAEWELAPGIIWLALARRVARIPRWPDRLLLDCRFPDPPHFEHKRLRRWRART